METKDPKNMTDLAAESIRLFNEFQAQSRARAEATLKLVLLISGGMLTLSVGAILSNKPTNIPPALVPSLTWGWGFLFYSISASLALMFSMIIATFHMGVRWSKKLGDPKANFSTVATWTWLRVLNAILGVSVVVSCLIGIGLMAHVAVGVAEALGTAGATSQVSIGAATPGPTPRIRH